MKNTYHIITIGCQMNQSDSERIASRLEEIGYKKSDIRKNSTLVVINTCGVRQSAEDRLYGLVPAVMKENPGASIVVSGCLSERPDVRKRLERSVDHWLAIRDLPAFAPALGRPRPGKHSGPAMAGGNAAADDYLAIKPRYRSRLSAYVPIGNGCDNFCAYCVVPSARGRETCRDYREVYAEAEDLVRSGRKEIILIAQNVNSYRYAARKGSFEAGHGISGAMLDFAGLLRLIDSIEGDFWIRFATSHPKDMSPALAETVAACAKVCEQIHLPAQAGDDRILARMNRGYTRKKYLSLLEMIRRKVPGCAITTDIIVGFPSESRTQFEHTRKLFEEARFDQAYIARYSPRPGTAAAGLADDVPASEKSARAKELSALLEKTALENNRRYVGTVATVLLKGKNRAGEDWGETRSGKKIIVDGAGSRARAGEFCQVAVKQAAAFGLRGRICG